jgi:methionyl-tRNA formyltransferase
MSNRPILLAASRALYADLAPRLEEKIGRACHFIGTKDGFNAEHIARLDPEFIFLPHWSYIVPRAIYSKYECVIFHMTDLPFGRGGSPLQNLIVRGFKETVICALRCSEGMDTGPVYLKRPLSLLGTAEEIYVRASKIVEEMILEILAMRPEPKAQQGEPVLFQRRKPEDGDLAPLSELDQIYDYIRMLDAEGYPRAFLETGRFRLEFSRASLQSDSVVADVRIIKK